MQNNPGAQTCTGVALLMICLAAFAPVATETKKQYQCGKKGKYAANNRENDLHDEVATPSVSFDTIPDPPIAQCAKQQKVRTNSESFPES